jgi:MscS family membrane protein
MMNLLLQINWSNLQTRIGGEQASNLLWCVGIVLGTLLLKRPLTKLLSRIITGITDRFTDKKHGKRFRDLTHHPLEQLLQTILFYIAVNQLSIILNQFVFERYANKNSGLHLRIGDVTDHIFLFLFILFTTLLLSRVIDFIYLVQQDKAAEEQNKERQQLLPLVKEIAKLLLWTIGLFWTLGTVFHVNIPALITGLGIGGVAIALAAKESVENLFAAFTILTDKPFHASDNIKLGSLEGVVERIGFRSTRLRSPDGSAFIIPNKKLVNENLENLTYRNKTRVKVPVSIKYGLSYADLQKIIAELKEKIAALDHINTPIQVTLESFGENVFQLLITYHMAYPLEPGQSSVEIKQEVAMLTYDVISAYTNEVAVEPAEAIDEKEENDEEEKSDEDDSIL